MEILELKNKLQAIIRNSQDMLDSLDEDPYRASYDLSILIDILKNVVDNKQAIELTIENEQADYQERIKLTRFYEDDKAQSIKSLM